MLQCNPALTGADRLTNLKYRALSSLFLFPFHFILFYWGGREVNK